MITASLFGDQQNEAISDTGEEEALQRYLRKFGCYAPERGDYYGEYAKQAAEDLQA